MGQAGFFSTICMQHFWVTLTTFLTRLYVSPLVTATGARGYCPAGGTAVLLCSDIRVISDVTSCGLNEVALGIPVPGFWARLLGRVVGKGPAHDMCINGAMLPAAKCVDLGLAHVSVPCHAVASEAESRVRRALELPDAGRVATKELIRGAFARAWRDFAEEEARYGWGQLCKPAAIASLDKVFARLKKGSQVRCGPSAKRSGHFGHAQPRRLS